MTEPDPGTDLYAQLGVGRGASTLEIRRAYRRLARQHHPDHNRAPGSPARFRALTEAYSTLTDPDRRARYDSTIVERRREPAEVPTARAVALRGTLELSAREAQLAARGSLRLVTPGGLVITLPAGIEDGDQVLVDAADGAIALTVCVAAGT